MARRSASLRHLLLLIGVGAIAYVTALALYLGLVVVPTSSEVGVDARAILEVSDRTGRRIDELGSAVVAVERVLRSRGEDELLPPDSADLLRASTEELLTGSVAAGIAELWDGAPAQVDAALARADVAKSRAMEHLLAAVDALERGNRAAAIGSLVEADSERIRAAAALTEARGAAFQAVIDRETEHQRASALAARLVAGWAILGVALLAGLFATLHRRVRRPMAALERSLERVAEGDLDTRLEVAGPDELSRLAEMFHHMTAVLRAREEEAAETRQGIVDRYSRILEEVGSNLVALDASTLRVLEASPVTLDRLGYSTAQLQTLDAASLWSADRGLAEDSLRAVAEGSRESCVFFAEQRHADGAITPVEVTAYRTPDYDPPAIIVVSQDVTQRRRLEVIRDQLARFALEKGAILQSGEIGASLHEITEMAARTIDVRRASVWLYENGGIECADLFDRQTGRHWSGHYIARDIAPAYFDALIRERTIAAGDAHTDERTRQLLASYLQPNGIGALLDAPVRVGGRPAGVVCHEHVGGPREWTAEEHVLAAAVADFVTQALEVVERHRAEQALQESERRYRAIFEQAAVGMAETDPDGRFRRTNPRLQEMLGYTGSELLELGWRDVLQGEDVEPVATGLAALGAGERAEFQREGRCRRKDGSDLWIELSAAPVWQEDGTVSGLISVATDVSEARDLQSQLLHAQRMESIGRLAGGIAHDFNNLLTAIIGHAELGSSTVREDDPVHEDLRGIEESALRASSLTRQLLTFARRQVVEPKVVELDGLVAGTESLLRRLLGEDIELVTDLGAHGVTVLVDPGQFEQVVVNLAVNARDAMPGGGRLGISTRSVRLEDSVSLGGQDLPPGPFVEVTVSDTGTGMEDELLERIFEPFFTTKPAGRGTGLGLATCYGIVVQAGGSIRVSSERGEGTTFIVLLPVQSASPEVAATGDRRVVADGGHETVLVAEDEASVRRLVVESLRRRGYEVLAGADGVEALEGAEGHEGPIDILVTDIVMPRMRGPQLAARLREARPDVPVLFMSGYSGSADTEEALTTEASAFLPKPFTPTQLTASVRALLDGGRTG